MELPTINLVGVIVFAVTLFIAVILPCIGNCKSIKPKVIKDESSSEEIAGMYPEVEPEVEPEPQ